MGLRQRSEQVGEGYSEEQSGEKMRSLRMQLPVHVPGLSVSVLLVAPAIQKISKARICGALGDPN